MSMLLYAASTAAPSVLSPLLFSNSEPSAFAPVWRAAELTPYIFAGVSGAAAIACALAALTLRRKLLDARDAQRRAERLAQAADLSLERIFFVGPEGGLRPATAATHTDARAAATKADGKRGGAPRLIEQMFGRRAVLKLAPLLEALARDGQPFELNAEDGTGAPTLYIGDVIGGQAVLRVWPEAETAHPRPEERAGLATRAAHGALVKAPVGVLIFDGGLRLISINDAARRLLRLRPERLEGAPSLRAVIDGLREAGRVPERADFAAWRAALLENPVKTLQQEGHWGRGDGDALKVTAERNEGGGCIFYVQNETDAVGLEQRYRTALGARRATLAAMEDGVAVIGADQRIQLVNPAFARLWGAPASLCEERAAGEAVFSDLLDASSSRASPQVAELWRRIDETLHAPSPRRAVTFEADKGDGIRLEVLATPLPDGASLIVMRDVTKAHQGAAALRARADSLEEADGLKTEFLNNIAYQLRTPLNAVLGFTDMLLREMVGPLAPKQREYVASANSAADELREIVKDALDLGALNAGAAELAEAPLDLGAAAIAISNALKARTERRGAFFRTQISGAPARFIGDEARLRHALYSVASTVAAAAIRSDAINLRYTLERLDSEGDDVAVIEISLSRATPSQSGGEALSEEENVSFRLARRIVEAHGGGLSLLSNAAGASARFEFPLSAAYTRLLVDDEKSDGDDDERGDAA